VKSPQVAANELRARNAELDMAATRLGFFLGTLIGAALVAGPVAFGQPAPSPAAAPQPKGAAKPATTLAAPAAAPAGTQPYIRQSAKPGETISLDANQRQLVDRVSLYLSTIQTLAGDFVQVAPNGSRTEGQFYLQKPGKVRFEYQPPNPIDVIADGRNLAIRNRQLATQDLYPLSQTPLRFLLANQLDLMRDTHLVGLYADATFVTVVIEERQPLIGTSKLMLMFGAKDLQLKQWTITDPQGYDTTIAVYNLDTNKRPDPSLFRIDYAINNTKD
jgi:outer membrane lipoprotein-sorting protein